MGWGVRVEMQFLPFTCVPMKHKTCGPDGIGVKESQLSTFTIMRRLCLLPATALAYGVFKDLKKKVFTKDKPTYVMCIDMGASAYTVSIASFEKKKKKKLGLLQ
jgi:hypothetical protein